MNAAAVAALQEALAAEHAAIHVYGALGARTSQASAPRLFATLSRCYEDHRSERDALVARVRGSGRDPVAAHAVYALPTDLSSASAIRAAALVVERACTATYAAAVAATAGDLRAEVLRALDDSAVRELSLGGRPQHFPGIAELTE